MNLLKTLLIIATAAYSTKFADEKDEIIKLASSFKNQGLKYKDSKFQFTPIKKASKTSTEAEKQAAADQKKKEDELNNIKIGAMFRATAALHVFFRHKDSSETDIPDTSNTGLIIKISQTEVERIRGGVDVYTIDQLSPDPAIQKAAVAEAQKTASTDTINMPTILDTAIEQVLSPLFSDSATYEIDSTLLTSRTKTSGQVGKNGKTKNAVVSNVMLGTIPTGNVAAVVLFDMIEQKSVQAFLKSIDDNIRTKYNERQKDLTPEQDAIVKAYINGDSITTELVAARKRSLALHIAAGNDINVFPDNCINNHCSDNYKKQYYVS